MAISITYAIEDEDAVDYTCTHTHTYWRLNVQRIHYALTHRDQCPCIPSGKCGRRVRWHKVETCFTYLVYMIHVHMHVPGIVDVHRSDSRTRELERFTNSQCNN